MASSERAQWARLDIDGVGLLVDLAAGVSIARPVHFESAPGWFGAPPAHTTPLRSGQFVARVEDGGSCNCSTLSLTPHASGTHTECVGHLTVEPLDAWRVIPQRLLAAVLLSVAPVAARDTEEDSEPAPRSDDQLITRAGLEQAWPPTLSPRLRPRAAILRTSLTTPSPAPGPAALVPPYLSRQAAAALVERGIQHLVMEVPSADRLEDDGRLSAHRIFFGMPAGVVALSQARRRDATITELALIPPTLADGWYLLALQTPAIPGDAVPSRPLLYALRCA